MNESIYNEVVEGWIMKKRTYSSIPLEIWKTDLQREEQIIYGLICSYQLNGLKCFASVENLASIIRVECLNVKEILKELEEKKLIQRQGKILRCLDIPEELIKEEIKEVKDHEEKVEISKEEYDRLQNQYKSVEEAGYFR